MKRTGWLISRYLLTTIFPYFVFSWLLLSVVLFAQQASRFSDIFFSVNIPSNLVWQLTVALIPNVIAFTCPMAILVGTLIGLTKMQGDSELVAIRAAGVGSLQIALPIMVLGVLLSFFAFFVNLWGVPLAAALVKSIALQTAIKKLESPIEPGVFNSELAGFTIYVKGGNFETGRWNNIFIYSEDKANGNVRLITSQQGRIDMSGEASELVLENAAVATLPTAATGKYVSENIGEVRFAIRTKRNELIEKLSGAQINPEELGLQQLSEFASSKDGKQRTEAQILWQRRILLSITPFIFCLLGTVIVLRFNRGGRGFGSALALLVLIGFYLLAFLGEQLARVGMLNVYISGLIPIIGSFVAILWFNLSRRMEFWSRLDNYLRSGITAVRAAPNKLQMRNLFVDMTTGLRDFDLIRNLLRNFVLTLCFVSAIFVIFTAFELWKFAGTFEGGVWLLLKYLFFLTPVIYLQIAPSAAMIATLATYVIKSRQNEIVTWTAAGQSIYRLLAPCFLLMLVLGGGNWIIQEFVLPGANQLQDKARTLLRRRGVAAENPGKMWVANAQRIYSFSPASDNETAHTLSPPGVKNLTIYEFENNGTELQSVYRAGQANWESGRLVLSGQVEKSNLSDGKITTTASRSGEVNEETNPFLEMRSKPSHLNSSELSDQIAVTESEIQRDNLNVALEKKHTTIFLPFVMALFTAPFSLSLNRKGKAATVGYAIGFWLLFVGVSGVFEQLGLNGYLTPELAVWSPLAIFSALGIFLLSKVRT